MKNCSFSLVPLNAIAVIFPALVLFCALPKSATATTYYVSASGSDLSPGTSKSSPARSIASVRAMMSRGQLMPGDLILFQRGGVWRDQLIIPSGVNGAPKRPITIGAYGPGPRPVIDGGSMRAACISAVNVKVSYITVDGFECRNTTEYGINFRAGWALAGIVIKNNYVHHTGPGACAGCGTPYDDDHYRNQINFEIDHAPSLPSGVKITNNRVSDSGGHNAIQVHGDSGGPLIRRNIVEGPCVHNCIDVKGAVNGMMDQNTASCPGCSGHQAAFYTENTLTGAETIIYSRNIAYDAPVAFQVESGASASYPCVTGACSIAVGFYNNTVVVAPSSYALAATSCAAAPMDFTLMNNIFDGGAVDMHSGCHVVWDYNNDGGSRGLSQFNVNGMSLTSAYGRHDLYNAAPMFAAPFAIPPDFALTPGSPSLYAGRDVGLPFTGRAPSMGAIDPGLAARR